MKSPFVLFSMLILVAVFISNCEKETIKIPTLSTSPVSEITDTTIVCGGIISNDGGAPITNVGVCWGENENPTIIASRRTIDDAGAISFTSVIKGFLPGHTYHIRAYATNSAGTAYEQDITATTNVVLPSVKTTPASSMTTSSAVSGGQVLSDGGAEITARGVCWNTTGEPTINDNLTSEILNSTYFFVSNLTELGTYKFYYLRAYATNSLGTAYGEQVSFRTRSAVTVSDIDGNTYNTVTIGTQVWMAENLSTTRYRNGTRIPEVTDDVAWFHLTTPAYCKYNNQMANAGMYGNLYNFYVVMDTNKVCPSGWHVPSQWEWDKLMNYVGGDYIAGAKIKEEGFYHWAYPNTSADNSSGFSALPGGYRGDFIDGRFWFISYVANFWTSENGNFVEFQTSNDDMIHNCGTSYISGKSIRCVKD